MCFTHWELLLTSSKCVSQSICEHKLIRTLCVPCAGGGICEHNKRKTLCVPCGGGGLCEHQKPRSECAPCKSAKVSRRVQRILDSNTMVRYEVVMYPADDTNVGRQPVVFYEN